MHVCSNDVTILSFTEIQMSAANTNKAFGIILMCQIRKCFLLREVSFLPGGGRGS